MVISSHPGRSLRACFFVLLLLACTAGDGHANTYSLDGAGAHVAALRRTDVRVVREDLTISPADPDACYLALFRGKPYHRAPDGRVPARELAAIFRNREYGTAGPRAPCPDKPRPGIIRVGDQRLFHPSWQASVRYEMEARTDAEHVLMGFPIQMGVLDYLSILEGEPWNDSMLLPEGWLDFLAVSDFSVTIDGRAVTTEVRALGSDDLDPGIDHSRLVYAWEHSFKAGAKTTVEIRYAFGEGGSDAAEVSYPTKIGDLSSWPFVFPDPARLSAGERRLLKQDLREFVEKYFDFSDHQMLYRLTPISTWRGGPPKEIDIHVLVGDALPATHLRPVGLSPQCVDARGLHYRLRDVYPTGDLDLRYPDTSRHVVPMRRLGEWRAWRKSLDGARIGCDLLAGIRARADKPLRDALRQIECVRECSP
jgi:hypothetical protein